MMRSVFCIKLKKQAQGLEGPPFPGKLGEKIYEHVSQEAWELWLIYQTKLINEHYLNAVNLEARKFLAQKREQFLFNDTVVNVPSV